MTKFIEINKNLCLVQQEIKSHKTVEKKRGTVNHIWIYDRSGSMTGSLPELTTQLVKLSKTLPKNDTLTLGWFSGEGDYNWVFKGFKITDSSDYANLEKSIKANASPRNTTCFSDILGNTDQVIADLSVFSTTFSLHFFTDGYPVVNNYRKELDQLFSAVQAIRGKITAAVLVGYGTYYNKELMTQMAEKLGAVLLHSSVILDYSDSVNKLIKLIDISEPKQEIEPVVADPLATFMVTNEGVGLYKVDPDGKLYVAPQKGTTTNVYYIATEKPNVKNWERVDVADLNFADPKDTLSNAMYAAALVLTQQVKTDLALEVVGKIGDKRLVDSLNNAFTIEEYGAAEAELNTAIQDNVQRFKTGRDAHYLPPSDAFCVFDLLNILMTDEKAAFFPYHKDFKYQKVSASTKNKEGYPKFKANPTCRCSFDNLVWNSSLLNLSVQTKVDGTVDLLPQNGVTPLSLGFVDPCPVFVFRNFAFIKDGMPNIKEFYLASSESTYMTLKNKGLVTKDSFQHDGVYAIDISKLPAINRKIATGKTSATDLCKQVYEEQSLKGVIKALKWLKVDVLGEKEEQDKGPAYLQDHKAFLESNGVNVDKGGLFDPQTEALPPTDCYMAKSFEIKIEKMSSLPPVPKVIEKINAGKILTPSEELVAAGIKMYHAATLKVSDKTLVEQWFTGTIRCRQLDLRDVRRNIQETKFAVILGKKWFDEFDSRDNPTLVVDGKTFKFELGEEKVNI